MQTTTEQTITLTLTLDEAETALVALREIYLTREKPDFSEAMQDRAKALFGQFWTEVRKAEQE